MNGYYRGLNSLQKISMSLMSVLVLLTFFGTNLQALFWQSSHWLVSTVLPAVVVDLTNEKRSQNHETPLVRSTILDKAAQLKAEDMAKQHYFSHYSPTGVSPWYWFDEAGYVYAYAGENLAVHFTDSKEVIDAWMNSPAHRENIVGSQYTEIGVGTAKGTYEGYDTVFVVQLFGTPAIAAAKNPVTAQPSTVVVNEFKSEAVLLEDDTLTTNSTQTPETALATSQGSQKTLPAVAPVKEQLTDTVVRTESEPANLSIETVSLGADDVSEVVVVTTQPISTSTGLAIAQVTTPNLSHAGATIPSVVTQPNVLLQVVYTILGTVVLLLLLSSIVLEVRRARMIQVTYSLMLIIGMGALWYVNTLLTGGAVVA